MNVKSINGEPGERRPGFAYWLIPLIRWMVIGVCPTSSHSQSHV
jgi:hypothetical protein